MLHERVGLLACTLASVSCEREARRLEDPSPFERTSAPIVGPYHANAWAVSEGGRLYDQMNCVGCHSHGGGGMGPALIDTLWIYGADAKSIFTSIAEGRPNGMPSYRNRLSDQQVWQLVAYVRALSGQQAASAEPVREDHIMSIPPRSRSEPLTPIKDPEK